MTAKQRVMGTTNEGECDSPDHEHLVADPAAKATMLPVTTTSAVATQLAFAAAAGQFYALRRFGSEKADAVSAKERTNALVLKRKELETKFVSGVALEVDANGLRDMMEYRRAVLAIRAKAVALGYGAQSQIVPIDSVPGGYVGRFGGNDIYAPAR